MKNNEKGQFVIVPFNILDSDIDDGCLRLWMEIKKFPKGNWLTNKALASKLGVKQRTIMNRLKILKEKSLITTTQKENEYGRPFRILIANTKIKQGKSEEVKEKRLSLQEIIKQENQKKMEVEGFALTHKEVEEIKNKYQENAQ